MSRSGIVHSPDVMYSCRFVELGLLLPSCKLISLLIYILVSMYDVVSYFSLPAYSGSCLWKVHSEMSCSNNGLVSLFSRLSVW